jgi:hypothetical protein
MNIITVNEIEQNHLNEVIEDMKRLGAPVVKAVWMECWDAWVALEGSHRVHAAKNLGLEVNIEEVEYSTKELWEVGIDQGDIDWMTVENFVDSACQSVDLMVEV